MKCTKQQALDSINAKREYLGSLSDQIWDNPETLFEESKSAEILCTALEQAGFQVERNLANIATAFSGKWGSGHPVIGFLGEFDALPNLSQEANVAVKSQWSRAVPVMVVDITCWVSALWAPPWL